VVFRPAPTEPAALLQFKTGDVVMLDGEPFVLKRPGKPGRKPRDEQAAS
jgi:hypothetical protein